nr:hypothetical protein [Tanacetum cinerariifolium]
MVAILEKSDAAQGFEQIIDFLSGSYIYHALTVNPDVYISCIKQFWNTAVVKRSGDVTRLQALVDKKRIMITEEVVREILQLDDAEGILLNSMKVLHSYYPTFLECQKNFMEQVQFCNGICIDLSLLMVGKGFSGVETPLFENMLAVRAVDVEKEVQVPAQDDVVQEHVIEEIDTEVVAASVPIPAAKPTAKPKVLKIVAAPVTTKKNGVVIRDPEEELHVDTPAETPTNAAFDHVQAKETQYIKRYHGFKKKPQSESEVRKDMISYLKNTEGFKMEFFKGKTYDQILPIFQARFDANMKFLFKSREEMEKEYEEIIKRINEKPAQKAAKRRKLSEEAQEADNLKGRLEIVPDEDDDVFVEAILLAQKVLVVDYQVVVIDNKPRYKIIRADDTHQLYISFTTLLKKFDREDLEAL